MNSDGNGGSAQEVLRERLARGEIGAEEYERSLEVLKSERSTAKSGTKRNLLVAGLAAAALIAVGGGVALAANQAGPSGAGGQTPPGLADSNGMSSMMSRMGDGQMGSMMGAAGSGQAMGSFDKKKPFDLQFIDQMTMHHEGAIMSAENMIGDSKRPELRKLAANIEKSQSEQIEQMQQFRKEWYPNAKQTFGMPPGTMSQMMGDGQMEQMMGGSMQQVMGGNATDEMFLEMMIPHHQMAVDMSERALKEAEHPKLKKLAQKIKDEQSAEIKLMKGYLEEIDATNSV